jgi:hypothetical protein
MANLREIEKYLSQKLPRIALEGFEVDKKIHSLAKKKIIQVKEEVQIKKRTAGAFGNKKRKKEESKQPKQRGKRILGQRRNSK